ncbi:MAG: enoyl-CoA hydratase/isomerase family protein [Hyphomicrobiaceae bacterium]
MEQYLVVEKRGAVAEITLNRPRALNALNDQMRDAILALLPECASDPQVYAVIMRSNSPRAFCAGGDVRELTDLASRDPKLAAASIGNEYFMNWAIDCFTKPIVSLIDSMVMGSGVGLVLYGTHRVAGEGFTFAMPETAIGLFPDVGVSHALARMPGHVGRYLGLTGRSIGPAAAYQLGLVTHCIAAEHFAQITSALEAADTVDPVLDGLHVDPEPDASAHALAGREALIEDVFGAATVPAILDALRQRSQASGSDAAWCGDVLRDLESRSPLSLCVTLRHLDQCRDLTLRDVLVRDYRLAVRFLREEELKEGVRAVLIDKDGQPNWRHKSVNDVEVEEIDSYFTITSEPDLALPEREKMQEIHS